MIPFVFAALSQDSTVCGLLGGAGVMRVYRDEAVPLAGATSVPRPYVVWQTVAGRPDNYLEGRPGIDHGRFQFDVYATTQEEADAVYTAVRDVLELIGHVVSFNGTGRDPTTRDYFVSWDMSIWTNR